MNSKCVTSDVIRKENENRSYRLGSFLIKLAMEKLRRKKQSSSVSVGNCEVSSNDESNLPGAIEQVSSQCSTRHASGCPGTSGPKESGVSYAALFDTSNPTILRLTKREVFYFQ